MATTTITVASFQTACAECADNIASGSWSTAKQWYARAEAINVGLDVQVGDEAAYVRRRESLSGLANAIDIAQIAVDGAAEKSPFIKTRVNYA
jgi:hypothetical protein